MEKSRHTFHGVITRDTDKYEAIDLVFAMSMLGQLVKREELIRYLKQLEVEFERSSPTPNTPNDDETNNINK